MVIDRHVKILEGGMFMNEQEDFFSEKHNRLLKIATWAKYLAWVVLFVYIILAIGRYVQEQTNQLLHGAIPGRYTDFTSLLNQNPLFASVLFVDILSLFLKGITYFLVLKGISLGLNMIVETDINYREQKRGAE